jgi:hypothetical protein
MERPFKYQHLPWHMDDFAVNLSNRSQEMPKEDNRNVHAGSVLMRVCSYDGCYESGAIGTACSQCGRAVNLGSSLNQVE